MAGGWRGQYARYRELSLNLMAIYKERGDIKAFLEIILSLSTLIVFILFALKPTILTMISLNQEINEKKATLDSLNQKISDLQTANSVFIQNQAVIPDIEASIFTFPKPDSVAKQILGIAQKNSVTVTGISIGQFVVLGKPVTVTTKDYANLKPMPDGVKSMPLTVTAKGDYQSLVSFEANLENLRIPIKIDNSVISSAQTQSGNTITSLISGRVPYLGQN